MEAGIAEDAELFGTLRLPRGGKHGYKGVRGRQGRERDQFQAYATVDNWKLTVPGLYGSAHEAAVALAQWRQQRELDLGEEPSAKRPRKKRSSKAEQLPAFDGAACCSELPPRWPLQPVCGLFVAFAGSNGTATGAHHDASRAAAARCSSCCVPRACGARPACVAARSGLVYETAG